MTEQYTRRPRDMERVPARDDGREERHAADPQAKSSPARERRASHRVDDNQKSGQGSLSALSKLKMQERKRDAMKPGPDDGS